MVSKPLKGGRNSNSRTRAIAATLGPLARLLNALGYCIRQQIDLVTRVGERERRAHRTRNTEELNQRLGAQLPKGEHGRHQLKRDMVGLVETLTLH